MRVPLPFSRNRPENHSHNLGNALGEGLGLLCAPFTFIPFTSLSLLPLYSFHLSLSLSLSLSYLSLPLYISSSTFLSLSLHLSVFSLSVAYLMDVFVLVYQRKKERGRVIGTSEFSLWTHLRTQRWVLKQKFTCVQETFLLFFFWS